MARILIVEDDHYRCSWFGSRFAGHELDTTADVAIAVEWLLSRDYDLIFLDHDLVLEHYEQEMADDGLTGYVVALWLAEHPDCQPSAQIIIHSLNFAGSARMRQCLEDAGRQAEHVPFPYLSAVFSGSS
ncbi:MAG TPA: cyclic-phosphate processing receiver domain-containing protein [Pyrinomonadaceae bacterium]|nr:cyclic-phosphate processing receiver domain-containing protein [Pyrinomonadaceae bacterium]